MARVRKEPRWLRHLSVRHAFAAAVSGLLVLLVVGLTVTRVGDGTSGPTTPVGVPSSTAESAGPTEGTTEPGGGQPGEVPAAPDDAAPEGEAEPGGPGLADDCAFEHAAGGGGYTGNMCGRDVRPVVTATSPTPV